MRLLYWCGLLHAVGWWRRRFGRKRLVVLLYHRLAPAGGDTSIAGLEFDDPVPVDRFERHLRVLRWFGEPLVLDQAVESLQDRGRGRGGPRTLIAVTFDDGYRDNFRLGRPVWQRLRVPVTLFLAVAPVARGDWLWWDELQKIIGDAEFSDRSVQPLIESLDEIAPCPVASLPELRFPVDRAALAQHLFRRMVDLPVEVR